MRRRSLVIVVALSVALVGLVGCATTGASVTSPSKPQSTEAAARVSIQSGEFAPRTVNIKVGDTVTWTNRDQAAHNVAGAGLVSGKIAPGKSWSHTFATPGTYNYISTLDLSSTGGLVIVAPK